MASPRPTGLRVLVADGHADAADSLALLLGLWGHEVRVARTGPEALEATQSYRPEVAFVEIVLPGLDGLQLARQLRDRVAVMVALTGMGQETYRQRAHDAGFDHFLVKPVEPLLLQQVLEHGQPCPGGATGNFHP
jgi:CheY-like chemotaxis protein